MDDRDFDVPDNATELAEEVRETERSLDTAALHQFRLMRLDQLRQMLAAFGLLVGTSKLPPPPAPDDPRAGRVRVHDGSTTKDPEMAGLLGLAVAILDTIVDQGGAGIALAYEGLVRDLAAAPSVAERELTWWRCMHNRAMLTYGLAPPGPADRSGSGHRRRGRRGHSGARCGACPAWGDDDTAHA